MGFINKEDGQFNQHQFNWPTEEVEKRPEAFHVLTKDEERRQGGIESKNVSFTTKNIQAKPIVINKKYSNLTFSESNMIMYLNSLELRIFDSNNPVIENSLSNIQITDENLEILYNDMVNNYNKKSFDPSDTIVSDANKRNYTLEYKVINESKSSPEMPTLEEFKQTYRLSGRKAAFNKMLAKRGWI